MSAEDILPIAVYTRVRRTWIERLFTIDPWQPGRTHRWAYDHEATYQAIEAYFNARMDRYFADSRLPERMGPIPRRRAYEQSAPRGVDVDLSETEAADDTAHEGAVFG